MIIFLQLMAQHRKEVRKVATILPVKIIFELQNVEKLDEVLEELEKIRDSHPDTVVNAEIRVQPEN